MYLRLVRDDQSAMPLTEKEEWLVQLSDDDYWAYLEGDLEFRGSSESEV